MRTEITWHQLVEWQQYYAVEPFGQERADLRSAMAGATIANEIRAIASGLAGKDLGAIRVRDLMIDTITRESKDRKNRDRNQRSRGNDPDRVASENYYKLWSKSIQDKLKDQKTENRPQTKLRSKTRSRRS